MYFRIATKKRGDKQYQSLHLVESYRTKEGKVRQRIVVNFGPAHPYRKAEVAEMIRVRARGPASRSESGFWGHLCDLSDLGGVGTGGGLGPVSQAPSARV